MKKQLVIIGILALLVSVGLSGCNNIATTSINDIREHPNRFINQTVTIIANYLGGGIFQDGDVLYVDISDSVKLPVPFVEQAQYRFTGIVRHSDDTKYKFTGGLYLEVTKIETT